MKPDIQLGPWPLGIDNVSDVASLKADDKRRFVALRDAVNVDIDRDGNVARRGGRQLALALPGLHSVWSGPAGAFGVAAGVLYALTAGAATPVAQLNSDERCSYDMLNGAVIVCNRSTLLEVAGGKARPLAVPDAGLPLVSAAPVGGLAGGRYGVAVSYMRGAQEGALSALGTVTLADGQGMKLAGIVAPEGVDRIRVYRTELGGTLLYHCTDIPAGMAEYLIGTDQLGREAPTQWLSAMPPGEHVAAWRGRLLVARGRTLVISEPMNYGLTSRRTGFVQFAEPILLVVGVTGGVYVGTRSGVVFLRGGKPGEWQQEAKSALAPVAGCRAVVDGDQIPAGYQQTGRQVAVWLSDGGFVLGCDDGQVFAPQSDRLRGTAAASGAMVAHARRFTATLH